MHLLVYPRTVFFPVVEKCDGGCGADSKGASGRAEERERKGKRFRA